MKETIRTGVPRSGIVIYPLLSWLNYWINARKVQVHKRTFNTLMPRRISPPTGGGPSLNESTQLMLIHSSGRRQKTTQHNGYGRSTVTYIMLILLTRNSSFGIAKKIGLK